MPVLGTNKGTIVERGCVSLSHEIAFWVRLSTNTSFDHGDTSMKFTQWRKLNSITVCLEQRRSSSFKDSIYKSLNSTIMKNNCFFVTRSLFLNSLQPLALTLQGQKGIKVVCVHHALACFWETPGRERTYLWKENVEEIVGFIVVPLFFFLSYRKWFQMKGIKVDNSWKNQSCCISKGILSVFRSLSLISPHSSGELNHSLHARYWPSGFPIETALL